MSSETILRLENIVKRFNDFTAVNGINLDILEGEFLTIVGPSGSGKSTLIRLLVGMDEVTEGAIKLRGRRIENTPARTSYLHGVSVTGAISPYDSGAKY